MAQQKDEYTDSGWPARLLHVASPVSYPREPGNIYGGFAKPRYNAISYTWGRFRLPKDESPEVKAMPIRGITWEQYLPRIHPGRFSNEDMMQAIKTAVAPYPDYPPTEFIWLDIACIDQTPGSAEMDREVGRQALIFRGAADVFIWLTTFPTSFLIQWTEELTPVFLEEWNAHGSISRDGSPAAVVLKWVGEMSAFLSSFTADEWFSSLWTLQEAFLCPKAILMGKDGITPTLCEASRIGTGIICLPRLDNWAGTWQAVKTPLGRLPTYVQARELEKAIDNLGFLEGTKNEFTPTRIIDTEYPVGVMGNPFNLLVGSSHRTTTREEDVVYGIMQVFDLQLGKSAPGATRMDFSLGELQGQLAAALVAKYPVISQMVVQDESCPTQDAWMVSTSLTLPEEAHQAWYHQAFGGEIICRHSISISKKGDTAVRASFSGLLSPVSAFYDTL